MPHDKNGAELNVGDEVTIRARVNHVYPNATTCNLTVQTLDGESSTNLTLNADHVERLAAPAATAEPATT